MGLPQPAEEALGPMGNVEGWVDFARSKGFTAQHFLTLTFDEIRIGKVSAERALMAWRSYVRTAMKARYGRRFERKYGRAAFSYMAAVDYSRLGAVHLHVVVDGALDYRHLHDLWGDRYGYCWTETVDAAEDSRVALAHVTKYATKAQGLVDFWFAPVVVRGGYTA